MVGEGENLEKTLPGWFASIGICGGGFAKETVGERPGWKGGGIVLGVEAVDDILSGSGLSALGGEEEEARWLGSAMVLKDVLRILPSHWHHAWLTRGLD